MGADCKSAGYAYAGSNPARPNKEKRSCELNKSSQEQKKTRFLFCLTCGFHVKN